MRSGAEGINGWAIKNPGAVGGAAKFVRNATGAPAAGIDFRNLYEAIKESNGNHDYKKK